MVYNARWVPATQHRKTFVACWKFLKIIDLKTTFLAVDKVCAVSVINSLPTAYGPF